jgi:glycolate oxidase
MTFNPVDDELIGRLRSAVGDRFVLTGSEDLEPYSHDETQNLSAAPEVVVKAGSTGDVSAVLRLASAAGVPVTARGAGTGKHGAAVPVNGGIVLSLERLNRILEIDRENSFAVVEPGVITEKLQDAAAEVGLFYAPDPASKGSCHLGGNIQTNAGGMRAVKYGVTADHVYGLTFVLPDGSVVSAGGKNRKDSSGYNLHRLIVGSEGTLAVVTQAILKLLPLPRHRFILLAPFPTLEDAARGVQAVFWTGITPSALEIMDRRSIEFAARLKEREFPFMEAEAHLLVEVDGNEEDRVAADLEQIGEALVHVGALDVLLATERGKQEELWEIRRVIGEALKTFSTYRGVDTVVPRARITDLVRLARAVGEKHRLEVVSFGHAGDGNLHVNLLRTAAQATGAEWETARKAAHEDVVKAAISLGGSISGEHGIGLTERHHLPLRHSPEAIALMRNIKKVFDPDGILNPGKVLP